MRRLFEKLEMDLVPGVAGKHTAPEDIAGSSLPHVKYLLLREIPEMKTVVLGRKIKTSVRARLAKIKQR